MNASAFMQDHGGEMLSVPVWFLDDSKFKRSFASPSNTYIVHYVMCSDLKFSQHFVAIVGTDAYALQLNEQQLAMCLTLWKEHGSRMVPSYRTGYSNSTDPFAVIDLTGGKGTTKKKRKRASDPLNKSRKPKSLYEQHPHLVQDWTVSGLDEGIYTRVQTRRDNTSLRPPVFLQSKHPFSQRRW